MLLPLLGRIVSGVGGSFTPAIYGVLARATTEKERTRYFAVIKGSNLLGIAFGPPLNYFLKDFNFYIGNWHIDFRTSPGFSMAVLWALVAVIMHTLAYDLSHDAKHYEPVSGELCEPKPTKRRELREAFGIESSGDEHDATPSSANTADVIERENIAEEEPSEESNKALTTIKNAFVDIFSKFQVIVPMYSLFFSGILYTSFQAITPLVAEHTLNWSENKVTLLFTIWGVEIVTVIFFLSFLSPKISDGLVLLTSAIFGILASASFFLLPLSQDRVLLLAIFFQGISLSAVVVCRSMVSKHTNLENQATAQAIVTASNRASGAIGPIIGSSLYTQEEILAAILSGSQILGMVLVIFLLFTNR